ncbi:MAG: alpha/beta hydrolase [Deltaproteobacteria bacterium]
MRKLLLRIPLFLTAALPLAGCASPFHAGSQSSLSRFEQTHIYLPARYPEGNWAPAGTRFEDVWFETDDGTRLNGWYLAHEKPAAVVLFAHGNAGNLTQYADTLDVLHDRHRVSVMIFDYRGYGKSDGEPDEAGILEDARAARRWLARREKIAEKDVVLLGQSLGGGVMVDLAANDGTRGLVLASTFTSLPDVAAHQFPLMPARLLMHNRLDSLAKIGRYHGPLLQVHGDKDGTIPLSLGKRLYAAANEPKRFVVHPGGDHNDLWPEKFHRALDKFLASLPPAHPLPQPPQWHRTRVSGAAAKSSPASG